MISYLPVLEIWILILIPVSGFGILIRIWEGPKSGEILTNKIISLEGWMLPLELLLPALVEFISYLFFFSLVLCFFLLFLYVLFSIHSSCPSLLFLLYLYFCV
jgi:hypothetical protein